MLLKGSESSWLTTELWSDQVGSETPPSLLPTLAPKSPPQAGSTTCILHFGVIFVQREEGEMLPLSLYMSEEARGGMEKS